MWYVIVMFNDGIGPELYGPYTECNADDVSDYFKDNPRVDNVIITEAGEVPGIPSIGIYQRQPQDQK